MIKPIAYEVNFDGLVGPTHHYAGLSPGNIASTTHAYQVANPKAAALQGLRKMRFLHEKGVKQAVLPPHPRPNLKLVHTLGFAGSLEQQLKALHAASPKLLTACFSASSMWAANCATITPSQDALDQKLHISPANLITQFHRHQEAAFSSHLLKQIFNNPAYFAHHDPLPATSALADEGAANHNRLCHSHQDKGLHIFVYGKKGLTPTSHGPHHFPARQTLEACETLARRHQIDSKQVFFVQQNPNAIDEGVFHHDVIGVTNESLMLIHEDAWVNQKEHLKSIQARVDFPMHCIEVPKSALTVQDAVQSYLFNSQIVTLPSGKMLLLAPSECEHHPKIRRFLDELLQMDTPIESTHIFDLKQSMQNGGGPACLRLRVVMTQAEIDAMHQDVLINDDLLDTLEAWVEKHYRDRLQVNDLLDPMLVEEAERALEALGQILKLKMEN